MRPSYGADNAHACTCQSALPIEVIKLTVSNFVSPLCRLSQNCCAWLRRLGARQNSIGFASLCLSQCALSDPLESSGAVRITDRIGSAPPALHSSPTLERDCRPAASAALSRRPLNWIGLQLPHPLSPPHITSHSSPCTPAERTWQQLPDVWAAAPPLLQLPCTIMITLTTATRRKTPARTDRRPDTRTRAETSTQIMRPSRRQVRTRNADRLSSALAPGSAAAGPHPTLFVCHRCRCRCSLLLQV